MLSHGTQQVFVAIGKVRLIVILTQSQSPNHLALAVSYRGGQQSEWQTLGDFNMSDFFSGVDDQGLIMCT